MKPFYAVNKEVDSDSVRDRWLVIDFDETHSLLLCVCVDVDNIPLPEGLKMIHPNKLIFDKFVGLGR